ncbi:MAG: tetratricopeptide repeat protein [Caldilineaceae bacterium]
MEWAIAERRAGIAMELADSLFIFWTTRGYSQEGQRWLEQVISLREGENTLRARIFNRMRTFAWQRGDLEAARQYQEKALAIQERIDDQVGISRLLQNLAIIAGMQGNYATTAQLLNRCLVVERTLNNPNAIKVVIQNLAIATERLGDTERAEALFRESLQIRSEQKDQVGMAHVLNGLANLLRKQGRLREASAALRQSLEIRRTIGNQREIALSLTFVAQLAVAKEQATAALRLYAVAQRINQENKINSTPEARQEEELLVQRLRTRLGAEFETQWHAACTLPTDEAIQLALDNILS